jgi:alpha-beta hydrolase superfamily lysophospholipase
VIRFTAERQDRTFTDAYGVTIHFSVWKTGNPKAIVQLAHGLGDHLGRYEELAQRLVNAGYTVYADDHRGHGRTGMQQWNSDITKLGQLGPGGMQATVEAVEQLTDLIRSENGDLPIALLGHSWGSVIAQKIINKNSGNYDAVVLSGTAYRTLRRMNGGKLNARHKHLGVTGHEWLSRDPRVAQAFSDDPLAFTAAALKSFGLADSIRLLGRPSRNIANDIPVLIQIGSDDPFGGPRSAELLAESYLKRSGLSDVELIIYTDARHEIFNETNAEEVMDDTIGWLDDRVALKGKPTP